MHLMSAISRLGVRETQPCMHEAKRVKIFIATMIVAFPVNKGPGQYLVASILLLLLFLLVVY